ncbi:hypothetical protein [Streptomyces sp. NPDC089799]|uniref:hypothetical protein n=1 Tax=Streptomyces sp. NPDC089799 TaxID=3155066 RepID=UPI003442EB7F
MAPAGPHHTFTARGALAVLAGTALAVTALTGCSSDPAPKAAPSPSATPSPSSSVDPQAAEKASVIATYQAFWEAQRKVFGSGSMEGTGLEKVATDKAYSKAETTRKYYVQNGTIMKGEPALSPKVSAIDMAAQPPAATITDCVDTTNYVQVYKDSGKPVETLDANRRHIITSRMLKIGGAWQVRDAEVDRDRTC